MDMELLILKLLEVYTQLLGVGTDVAEGDRRRLLHHIAEAPSKDQTAILPRLQTALDKEDLPTDTRPSKANDHAWELIALILVARIYGLAKILTHQLGRHLLG